MKSKHMERKVEDVYGVCILHLSIDSAVCIGQRNWSKFSEMLKLLKSLS